jgi:arginine exporter protein ArgO
MYVAFPAAKSKAKEGGEGNIIQTAVKSKRVKVMQGKFFIVLAPHYYVNTDCMVVIGGRSLEQSSLNLYLPPD